VSHDREALFVRFNRTISEPDENVLQALMP